jgi:MbtH protein
MTTVPSSNDTWIVLLNIEGQYAVWPVVRPVPKGWREVGPEGDQGTCLVWIDQRWSDMRPLSLR